MWSDEFKSLDLVSLANPNGLWRPSDVWQPMNQGYADFGTGGHSTWLANPAQELGGHAYNPFSVKDSVLSITARRTPQPALTDAGNCPWLGGMLISNTNRGDMIFGYGYYEFRVRFAVRGKGMFPALWLYAAHNLNGSKGQAELDVLEVFGGVNGPWIASLHKTSSSGQRVFSRVVDLGGWHTYGVAWSASRVDLYFDRRLVASATGPYVSYLEGSQMSIRMNLSMDATFFADTGTLSDASTPSPLVMEVDYVRKYDRPF